MQIKSKVCLVLNDIRSAYNVDSIFRTADGAGVAKIYLCGITPTPGPIVNDYPSSPSSSGSPSAMRISKTALGAEKTVPWEYHKQVWRLLKKLEKEENNIVALEQSPRSVDYRKFKPKFPITLVVGNEVKGLNKKTLSYTDKIIEIPMRGKKESLNVAVAIGIAVYNLLN